MADQQKNPEKFISLAAGAVCLPILFRTDSDRVSYSKCVMNSKLDFKFQPLDTF